MSIVKNWGVYIHWPYCLSKCPYCDFNSHVRDHIAEEAWLKAILKELTYYQPLYVCSPKTIFFGGGTPSLMHPSSIEKILNKIDQLWGIKEGCEITMEANPNSVESDKFRAFREAGINRISVGIQSLNQSSLTFLGRKHTAEEAKRAINISQSHFENSSFDLIYARPKQTINEWKKELQEALTMAGPHLSLYQLTIEPATKFKIQFDRGDFKLPEDDKAAEFYEVTQAMMEKASRPAYEISNHAMAGKECQHNLLYWRYDDYLGVGPGAHGRITDKGQKIATQNIKSPEIWSEQVEQHQHGQKQTYHIDTDNQFEEKLMMGLRLSEGIKINQDEQKNYINQKHINMLIDEGYLTFEANLLKPTLRGYLCLNAILPYILSN